jgi:hypothetical protein
MIIIIILFLLVLSFIVFMMMNRGGERLLTFDLTPMKKPQGVSAQFVRVGKDSLSSNIDFRFINLMEIYVYDMDGTNVALKKPSISNALDTQHLSKFNDGDELTLGRTLDGDTEIQRQYVEIDLGRATKIKEIVILNNLMDAPQSDKLFDKVRVTLLDDDLEVVTKTPPLTIDMAKKGSRHRYNFMDKKWILEPVDCVGKWGPWSPCSAKCRDDNKPTTGTQERSWIVIRPAENGGKPCEYDIEKDGARECQGSYGAWTGWSGCSKGCGTGSQSRKFVVNFKGTDGGSTCIGGPNGKSQSRNCNTHGCPRPPPPPPPPSGGCFSLETKMTLKDGRILPLREIKLGDELVNGSVVRATMQIMSCEEDPFYKIYSEELNDYIYVTGSHYIKHGEKYVHVSDFPEATKTSGVDKVVGCFVTSDHTIVIGERTFWDWEDNLIP